MDVRQLFKNLKKEAECPLCLDTLKEPKTLPCLHSFCLVCLDKYANFAKRQLQTTVDCPVCLTSFQIPEEDTFAGLPTSFHLNRLVDILALGDASAEAQTCSSCEGKNIATCYCFDCHDVFCDVCVSVHNQMKISRGHRNVSIHFLQAQDVEDLIHRPVMCAEKYHEKEQLEYYCQECKVCICHKCGFVNHDRHAKVDIQQAAEEQKMQMMDVLEKAKAKLAVYIEGMKRESELFEKSKEEIVAAQNKVRATVEELVQVLREHETAMITKLAVIYETQQKAHATQHENFELFATQLRSSVEHGESIIQRNIGPEILQGKFHVVGRLFYCKDDQVTVKIQTPTGKELKKKFEDNKDGKYTVTYTAEGAGQHDVVITVNGQPLPGSPWSVYVTPHQYKALFAFGTRGKGHGQFDEPEGIAVSARTGNIAVAEVCNERIQMFSSELKYLRDIGQKGPGTERLNWPSSVAFTRSGDVIVSHGSADQPDKISVFTEGGQFIKHITKKHLKDPWRVSVGRDGLLIVCDFGDKKVKVLSSDGTKLLQSFSSPDCDEAASFAVYHQDKFFVSFGSAHCVRVFNNEGVFLYNIGSKGSGDGQLNGPVGLAVDKLNNLIVCDSKNSRLQVFTLDGQFVTTIGGQLTGLSAPRFVAVSNDGHVYVTDEEKHCVHIFQSPLE